MKKWLSLPLTVLVFVTAILLVTAAAAPFAVKSPAVKGKSETGFDSGLKSAGRIDAVYAAKDNGPGNRRSLPLAWSGLPSGTKALALIMDDPDAKPVLAFYGKKGDAFLHWIAADINPAQNGLADNASADKPAFPQGYNGAGFIGYTGPQPPRDIPAGAKKPLIHIYRLTLYALSAPTGLTNGFTLNELKSAIKDKTLGTASLYFSYNN